VTDKLFVDVTYDADRGYVARSPELRAPRPEIGIWRGALPGPPPSKSLHAGPYPCRAFLVAKSSFALPIAI